MGHWFVDTAGIGSIIVLAVGFCVLAAYVAMLRWIQTAPPSRRAAANPQVEETAPAEAGGEQA